MQSLAPCTLYFFTSVQFQVCHFSLFCWYSWNSWNPFPTHYPFKAVTQVVCHHSRREKCCLCCFSLQTRYFSHLASQMCYDISDTVVFNSNLKFLKHWQYISWTVYCEAFSISMSWQLWNPVISEVKPHLLYQSGFQLRWISWQCK